MAAVGNGCGVVETAGVAVGGGSVALAMIVGVFSLNCVAVGVESVQEKRIRSEKVIGKKCFLCIICSIKPGNETLANIAQRIR